MGVHGLWRLIEPSGKTVPVETLENKILAVDVSIWLHQAVKGFQDSKGQPLPNAHLLGIYHRICKLLYFRIKPVFVFDGGVPALKKQTIAKRNQQKAKNFNATERIHKQLLSTLLKHSAVNKVLSEKAKANIEASFEQQKIDDGDDEDLFALPPQMASADVSSEEDLSESTLESDSPTKNWDIHSIDMDSSHFRSLPADVRHEILTEVKETRKQSSWGRLHELPTKSDAFAIFQLNRLRKRYQVQVSLEEAEKEMGGHSLSLVQLEKLLNDQGVITKNLEVGNRIASDDSTRYLLIKDVKKAVETAKQEENKKKTKADVEYENDIQNAIELSKQSADDKNNENLDSSSSDEDLKKAIQLSLECEPSSSQSIQQNSFNVTLDHDDFMSTSSSDSEDDCVLASAKNYMMEYSGLTPAEIAKIIGKQGKSKKIEKVNVQKTSVSIEKEVSKVEVTCDSSKNVEVVAKPTGVLMESVSTSMDQDNSTVPEIDIMSDSDSSENFEDVSSQNKVPNLEIVIKPTDTLDDDDLFSDIFEKNERIENNETLPTISDHEKIETQEPTKVVEPIVPLPSPSKDRNQVITEREKTIDAIRGMLKSVKQNEALDKDKSDTKQVKVSVEELQEIQANLSQESKELRAERSTKERMASNITDQMYQEAQELLELFGVPYIVAPMEAEAQCAFLDAIGLTDGTITDDSDIWLFGGKTVYKNFFNQSKRVMEYKAEDIQHFFKLTREQMVLLALLVGSDYTTGIQGIGPVTALEILAAFPANAQQLLSGLSEFRKWYLGATTKGPTRNSLRRKLKNLVLSENFPSLQVVQAYLDPHVERSKETFSWAKPDVVGLVDFAKQKFGWNRTKSEEILKPVLKRLEERYAQTSLLDYFKTKHKIDSGEHEKYMSKRVKKALDKIGKGDEEDSSEEKESAKEKRKTIRKAKGKKVQKEEDADIKVLKQTKARSSRKLAEIEEEAKRKLVEEKARKSRISSVLHTKEVIVQKELDKKNLLRSKLKAIEVFRKSKQGPGYIKKRAKVVTQPKEDAELSESSSSD